MDKLQNGNTIIIKLNGEAKEYKEVPVEKEPVPNSTEPQAVQPNPPEQAGMMEIAAAQEAWEEFDWILPDSSDLPAREEQIPALPKINKRAGSKFSVLANQHAKSGAAFKSAVFSIIFAILIGTGMGLLLLKLVFSQQNFKQASSVTSNIPQAVNGSIPPDSAGKKNAGAADSQSITAFVVQGGVFSTASAAAGTAGHLKSQGVPSVIIESGGKDYLLVAVAESLDSAQQLANTYKDKGIREVYAKPLLVEGKKIQGLSEAEKSFLAASLAIYQNLAKAAAGTLSANSLAGSALKNADEQLTSTAKQQILNKDLNGLKKNLEAASAKIKAYQSTRADADFAAAQQELLNYLSKYFSMPTP